MYNANKPNPEELPSSTQLLKSTILAIISAIIILVTIVLPSEYGIDPTRIGRILGLAEMGQIKAQLAEEAEADKQKQPEPIKDQSSFLKNIQGLFVSTAYAQTTDQNWKDTLKATLAPGKWIEIKLAMDKGAVADFRWDAKGGKVNYDLHGDGSGQKTSYKRGRFVTGHKGTLKAAFAGNHGWFWRNRDKQPVTISLFLQGDYGKIKRISK